MLRECREMIGDKDDALLQQTIKRLLVIPDKERAASIFQIKDNNDPLSLLFESFERKSTVFTELIHPQIFVS